MTDSTAAGTGAAISAAGGTGLVEAADCHTMAELRRGIDEIDRRLVALLARRAGFIDRAAEIKTGAGLPARIDSRIEEVVTRVREAAGREGLDPELAEQLWRQLIEWAIRREEAVLGPDDPAAAG